MNKKEEIIKKVHEKIQKIRELTNDKNVNIVIGLTRVNETIQEIIKGEINVVSKKMALEILQLLKDSDEYIVIVCGKCLQNNDTENIGISIIDTNTFTCWKNLTGTYLFECENCSNKKELKINYLYQIWQDYLINKTKYEQYFNDIIEMLKKHV